MKRNKPAQVRIIGGAWRGRKLTVADIKGLRPTPDRVRETLFNWLADDFKNTTVLDCFSGSGALGFEAASRGAKRVTMVEQNHQACTNLQTQIQRLNASQVELLQGDAVAIIARLEHRYDMVFIDPPYAQPELRHQILESLIQNSRLKDNAKLYLEWPLQEAFELTHSSLRWRKRKKAGQIHYAIAEWQPSR